MLLRLPGLFCTLGALIGCATPYTPPVLVAGGANFPGIVGIVERSGSRPVDVILVHGMCTHGEDWANGAIDVLLAAVDINLVTIQKRVARMSPADNEIQIVSRTVKVAGGTVRFWALIWSPLTAPLKSQLKYDNTGEPTDCSMPGTCKPIRAKLNGQLKDGLLNDCLADALIYQGESKKTIRGKMVDTINKVIEEADSAALAEGTTPGPLVLVSESLGSKVVFDALDELREASKTGQQSVAGQSAEERLALVFMGANQLPILGLADQDSEQKEMRPMTNGAAPSDSLQRLLKRKSEMSEKSVASFATLTLVAFTDPNDLLSYRLQASRYIVPGVDIADVLVSNDSTYFGYLERPDTAHTDYRKNPGVASLIACGRQKSSLCR